MGKELTTNAQAIQDVLHKKGLECKVIEFPSGTRTAKDAADSIGCELAQIAKSLIFKTNQTSRPVLVLASGPNRVNEDVIAAHAGENIVKADAEFTREITGFAIGGIPPIGHKHTIELVFIDRDLLQFDTLWTAAGNPNAVFSIASKDLLSMVKGKVIAIC
ncbi:MAG: YbaK/EbsC family protein [Proteobacteria bacterium]|nr:YbaK/EbsC family protein [Pseudomonadota bacterium]